MDKITNTAKVDYFLFIEKKTRSPSYQMSCEHCHDFSELFYLKTGRCVYIVNGLEYQLDAGDFLVIAPGKPHSTRYEGPTQCERITFYCQKSSLPQEFREKHPEVTDILDQTSKITLTPKKQLDAEKLVQRILQESIQMDAYAPESIRYLTLCLLISLKRDGHFTVEVKEKEACSRHILDAIEYIRQNYSLPLTLEEAAQKAGLSPTYFSKKFHQETGSTYKKYVNEIRVLNAKQMLLSTDDSVTKIAISCGFGSSNYFKDVFRKMTGISPRDYRKKAAEASE
ncbi:MAG: AraC family transcriptional regulator [Lachnospiraceae bacterium]|nr:AraC family transcriptional regulator [Lachnospiraceae bacterium]